MGPRIAAFKHKRFRSDASPRWIGIGSRFSRYPTQDAVKPSLRLVGSFSSTVFQIPRLPLLCLGNNVIASVSISSSDSVAPPPLKDLENQRWRCFAMVGPVAPLTIERQRRRTRLLPSPSFPRRPTSRAPHVTPGAFRRSFDLPTSPSNPNPNDDD